MSARAQTWAEAQHGLAEPARELLLQLSSRADESGRIEFSPELDLLLFKGRAAVSPALFELVHRRLVAALPDQFAIAIGPPAGPTNAVREALS